MERSFCTRDEFVLILEVGLHVPRGPCLGQVRFDLHSPSHTLHDSMIERPPVFLRTWSFWIFGLGLSASVGVGPRYADCQWHRTVSSSEETPTPQPPNCPCQTFFFFFLIVSPAAHGVVLA